jgi:death-on-curing protein
MSFSPKFLTLNQVMTLHEMQIDQFGGSHGVKDEGLLLSALAFVDGNKRIAALTAAVFLEVNGLIVTADENDFDELVLDAAQSRASKEKIAEFFRKNTTPAHE